MGYGSGIGRGGIGRGYGYGAGRAIGQGSGRFSGFSCVKFSFFIFNVVFWVSDTIYCFLFDYIFQVLSIAT